MTTEQDFAEWEQEVANAAVLDNPAYQQVISNFLQLARSGVIPLPPDVQWVVLRMPDGVLIKIELKWVDNG